MDKISAQGAVELVKNLRGTAVHTLHLAGNQIDDQGAAELAKSLKETDVRTLNLGPGRIFRF